jgi:hypothetical protein
MRNRSIRNRRSFQLESLEIRNAPSHFGGLAHAAAALHQVHAHTAAQMRHFSDPQSPDKNHKEETSSGVDQSRDNNVGTTTTDRISHDPSGVSDKSDR